ncbi:ABC transporter substrate-binding protein [Streptomyces sp. NPDC002896]|uniref:ABC transporter substrate-binding protein n=1 Tax=Streptomyces sp. NPDC002896 TaxID=3154438 RepID=UPI003319F016
MDEQQNLQKLYEEARAEGGQLVVWAGGDAKSQSLMYTQAFQKEFPDIDISAVVQLSKYHDTVVDFELLHDRLTPDVVHLQSLHDYTYWKQQGVLERFRPMGLEHVPERFVDPDGFYVPMFVFAFSNVYDSRVVPDEEAPIEAGDYLDPRWKGRIVLTYPHDDDAVLYQFDQLVAQFGWSWLEQLLTQDVLWVRGTQTPVVMVGAGEKAVSFTSYSTLVDQPGNPVRFRIPERTFFQSWYQTGALFKASRHKAAGRLYLSWWLSAQQQARVFQWPAREDVPVPDGFRHVRWYDNTSPWGFWEFMHDRARVERLKGIFENYIGPVQGPDPNTLDM